MHIRSGRIYVAGTRREVGLNIFFDVDDTIIFWIENQPQLRLGVRETFAALTADGHSLYLWSGVGIRTEIADLFGLWPWITQCFCKPKINPANRLAEFHISCHPDFVVDDYAEIVAEFDGTVIGRYRIGETGAEFARVLREVRAFAADSAEDHALGAPDATD